MKYRIKSIRREGWVETEEKLFRPAEEVTPVVIPDETVGDGEAEIYIIPDEEPATESDDTVIFTPPAPAAPEKQPEKNGEKKPLFPFLKTKESKVIAGVIGGFALLLIIFIIVVVAMSSGDGGDNVDGGNNTGHTHVFQTIVDTQATCTEKGITKEKCSVCGFTTGEESVDALGHKWKKDESNSEDATCEKEGKEVRQCERCGEKETVTLEPLEHDWEEDFTNQATCEKDGTIVKTCKNCGKKETEEQQAKGHTWIETTSTEATCEKEGEINFRCASCEEKKTEVTAKKEHDLSDPVRTEPTCEKEGSEVATCRTCGNEVVTTIEKLPHELEPATCETGEKCKVCGEEVSEPLGHKYVNGTCTVCGKDQDYGNTGNSITVGEEMQIGTGISLYAKDYSVDSGKLTINVTVTVTAKFTAEEYYFTPDKISVTNPDGSNAAVVTSGSLFNLPSSGSVSGSVTVADAGKGEYVLHILGEDDIYHTCHVIIE